MVNFDKHKNNYQLVYSSTTWHNSLMKCLTSRVHEKY